eukprot:TRINITY_DN61484_c0_g1_i1.p2 TRINITY_DN61484_c0_g1~~TRINITY_DN61484_c0_g1_i1.p2  ORF type:complete len:146 (+),score=14.56 TRINITY_DN61484_c0_g1_i1:62-439(+)
MLVRSAGRRILRSQVRGISQPFDRMTSRSSRVATGALALAAAPVAVSTGTVTSAATGALMLFTPYTLALVALNFQLTVILTQHVQYTVSMFMNDYVNDRVYHRYMRRMVQLLSLIVIAQVTLEPE